MRCRRSPACLRKPRTYPHPRARAGLSLTDKAALRQASNSAQLDVALIEKEQWSPTRAFRPGRAEQRTFMSPTGASGRGAERDPVKSEVDAGPARTSLPIDERQSR